MNKFATVLALAALPLSAAAAQFDGSRPMVCAIQTTVECDRLGECVEGPPETVNAPDFFNIDIKKKRISAERLGQQAPDSKLKVVEKLEDRIIFLGAEQGRGWSGVIDTTTGRFTGGSMDNGYSFLLFGACHVE